jgi:hypothetical protein
VGGEVNEMNGWIQKQLEISEKLYEMMAADHKERMECVSMMCDTSASLVKKLAERDAEIARLRAELQAYRTAEKL